MTRAFVIALDGPAAAGKSTVGPRVADRLGFFYFDTGVLYRAVAARALRTGHDPGDESALEAIMGELDVRVSPRTIPDGLQYDVLVNGVDESVAIRQPAVDASVSAVAASRTVRQGLIELQRAQIRAPGTIMVGRDIGTVVCPDADLKIYLDANPRERAERRLRQSAGRAEDLETVMEAVERRDRLDSERALAPLTVAVGAEVIDTDNLSVDEVAEQIVSLARARGLLS